MTFLINSYRFAAQTDADAEAFFTAAGITDSTQKAAVTQLVINLKAAGIWSKCLAIYPFVGGTASTHKYNLKDPQDTDAAFRLSFIGGWTHSSNGALPNGTTGYADTFLNASVSLSQNSTHISAYSRTQSVNDGCLFGNNNDAQPQLNIFPAFSSQVYFRVNSGATANAGNNTDTQGLFVANRVSSTETRNRHKSTSYIQSANSTGLGNTTSTLARQGSTNYGNWQYAFASIGSGLSDSELTDLKTHVDTFQTALSRNV